MSLLACLAVPSPISPERTAMLCSRMILLPPEEATSGKFVDLLAVVHKKDVGCIGFAHVAFHVQHNRICDSCVVGLDFGKDVVDLTPSKENRDQGIVLVERTSRIYLTHQVIVMDL